MKSYSILILAVLFFFYGCKEKSNTNKVEMKIFCAGIDTLSGLEFAYGVNLKNNSNKDINFYTGLDQSENTSIDGFYLNFKKLGKSFQMVSFANYGALKLSAKTKQSFIIDVCFREYCTNVSAISAISDTYYKSKTKLEIIKEMVKDISIEYRVNKTWDNKNYQAAFLKDSIIFFNRLDTIDTKFYTEITGDTFSKMLRNEK